MIFLCYLKVRNLQVLIKLKPPIPVNVCLYVVSMLVYNFFDANCMHVMHAFLISCMVLSHITMMLLLNSKMSNSCIENDVIPTL